MNVLIVEDEFLIRELLCMELTDGGHSVSQAANADDALVVMNSATAFDLIITDIDMPGSIDGLRLAAVVRDGWPPIKIIVASGKHRPTADLLPSGAVFLPKPYHGRHIFEAIGKVGR